MHTHEQKQSYKNNDYSVSRLIDFSKKYKTETVDIRCIDKYYTFLDEKYDIVDFVNEIKRIENADLKYPILIHNGFIMDGKHRLAKAIWQGKKTIKVKFLEELPTPNL